ncbi:site-specific integrase [Mangrovimonas sp. TPBH4]|uniref:tyrosine-type recombinase/integrase n=1 Tax=Mangrovimonas sp. TPBH4 TaxID=1645914 RepID=UPI0006B6235A|nr:site-specific integrase [Mangrovimonas sp. TPBH4]
MSNLNELVTFEHENEHVLEHDLPTKKLFSTPKIHTAKGDLSKRWYVYFSYRNPETGKLERYKKNIYGVANSYKTKEERMTVLSVYRQRLLKLLKEGYSPYENNLDRYNGTEQGEVKEKAEHEVVAKEKPIEHTEVVPEEKEVEIEEDSKEKGMGFKEALDFDFSLKSAQLRESSLRSYKSHIKVFYEWFQKEHPEVEFIEQVDRKLVLTFLTSLLETSTPRNRNNYRASLSSLFQTLEDNDIVPSNFVGKIKVLKSTPKRNKSYSKGQQEEIFEFLEKEDPTLLLFIKFISYNFLRPLEVCRLKVGDIDLKHRTLSFEAKNSPMKTKIIPDLLLRDLPDLSNKDKGHYLFTPEGIGGEWETSLENKRNYFTKRFKKVVKESFGLGEDHGLYSFRHTFITKLYRALVADSSPHAAKSKLMQITGHSSMTALEKYLRDIDAELPEDYSAML